MSRPLCMMLAGALALLSSWAQANPDAEREARALFKEGNDLVTARDYSAALARFQKAYALLPNAKILLNIGTMLHQLGRDAEAANVYAQYLVDPAADPKRRTDVEPLLREIDARVARLEVDIRDMGGRVLVDGQAVGQPGKRVTVRVAPGTHTVTIEQQATERVVQQMTLSPSQTKEVVVAPPASSGSVPVPTAAEKLGGAMPSPEAQRKPARSEPARAGRAFAAAPLAADAPEKPVDAGEERSHAGQFGGVVRADVDGVLRGGLVMVGASYGLNQRVEIGLGALLSPISVGFEPNAVVYLLEGAAKPMLSLGLPVFIPDEAYPGFRASAGLQWDPSRHFGLFAQLGVSLFPAVPEDYDHVVLLPSLGMQSRL